MTTTTRTVKGKLSSSVRAHNLGLRKYGSRTDMMTIGPTACPRERPTLVDIRLALMVSGERPHAV